MISDSSKSSEPLFFGGGSNSVSEERSTPLYMGKSPPVFGGGSDTCSIRKSYPLSGGGSTSSKKDTPEDTPKNDLEEGFKIGFNDGYIKGIQDRNKSSVSSFNSGYITCYMKHVLLPEINTFTIPSLVSSELVNNENIEISVKGIINNSFLHVLSISVVIDDSSLTYIVNAYECTPNNGDRTILYEKIYLDIDNFIIFLSDKINEYLNSN